MKIEIFTCYMKVWIKVKANCGKKKINVKKKQFANKEHQIKCDYYMMKP